MREVVERRAPAAGPLAGDPLDDLDAAVEPVRLLVGRELARMLVQEAVVGDLVPAGEDRLDGGRILLDAPGRDEEGLADAERRVAVDDARDRDLGPVAQHRDRGDAAVAVGRMRDMDQAVGVHVEGHASRATGAVRPGDGIADHAMTLPPLTPMPCPVT